MFGYVKANKGELKVWEYEAYKAIYCSLCKELGKSYGPISRFTLNYDFVFLALLNMSLSGECNNFITKRCPFNPLKKCKICQRTKGELTFAAGTAMIMLYYKILDNIADSKGFKKLGYKIIKPMFKSKCRKAAKVYPQIEEITKTYIENQSRLEKQNCTNLDQISEPTCVALGKIFKLCGSSEADKRVLENLGFLAGKWIYLTDAANDLQKDIKNGNFNPLIYDMPKNANIKEYAKLRVEPILNTCIYNMGLSFELLPIQKYKGILENIIYLGLKETQSKVFKKENNQ